MTARSIKIIKCHGSGNDFVMIDELTHGRFTEAERRTIAKLFCEREGILGADGVLYILPSAIADGKMRMFNPDGSEPQTCGNGLRCVARYLSEKLGKISVLIETMKGVSLAEKDEAISEMVSTFRVEVGPVSLSPASLPLRVAGSQFLNHKIPELSADLLFSAVSVPNPHLISRVRRLDDQVINTIGGIASSHSELLPEKANVSFYIPIDATKIGVATFERGVGVTASCGSAMAASTLVSCLLRDTNWGENITVFNRGGYVRTRAYKLDDGYRLWLSGNATFVFTSVVECDLENETVANQIQGEVTIDEILAYGKVLDHGREVVDRFYGVQP